MKPNKTKKVELSSLYLRTVGWAYLAERLPTPHNKAGWSSTAALELGTLIAECGEEKAFERWLNEGAV